ncbi:MAG: cation-translocating P-type ATPase [Ardenticatenaceae bacterium]|nr:cation-translocating P-type ATPase [Ardenticatenaceae bacterium]
MTQHWHTQPAAAVLQHLKSSAEDGLTTAEAAQRLAQYGVNELIDKGGKHPLRLLWEQISSTMVLILIVATAVSAFLGKATEAAAIGAIVVLFVILGFVQEFRAEKAMAALKQLAVPLVRARRDGKLQEISARDLVPGDVVLLEAGNAIPADARVIEAANLRVQEAALTGESEAVEKETAVFAKPDLPLGDRRNMLYMGTNVSYGRGTAVVTATGMETELGKIATLIQSVAEGQTLLQKQLDRVGQILAVAGVVVAALVLLIGVLSGEALDEMFLTAISVAVAVVPEGLPAVVTITLALGAQRMLRRSALIRKLPAVETLGSVTTICSDKTGTLTVNRMTVTIIDVAGHYLELAGTGEPPLSSLKIADNADDLFAQRPTAIGLTLAAGALCNDASVNPDPETGRYTVMGDPTEGALLVAAQQAGVTRDALASALPRIAELPFDSDRKRMTTVHQLADGAPLPPTLQAPPTPYIAFTKGAVDGLLDISTQVWDGDRAVPLDEKWRTRIDMANTEMAQKGMRVLGLALQWLDAPTAPLEQELVFVGLVGMIDPPRPEVKTAVATAKSAGIRPIMITGDHPLTARFIAHDLGISENGRVKTGQNLEQMSAEELDQVVDEVSIYARVSPEHKLRIVEALQRKGQIVAMTGDGVNDSPALRKADIGIAMGITGTDVSKEASEMVLLDDNFATIVAAVEEGRVIYDNIRRFVKFSIAGNLGKVLVMLAAPLLGIAVALEPLQLLWLNLLTDGLLGLGLGVEPAEKGVMKRSPRSPQASLFNDGLGGHIIWVGVLIGVIALLIAYAAFDPAHSEDDTWQTMLFTTLAFLQVGQALASRSGRESFFALGWRSNPTLLWLTFLVVALQLVVIYLPALETFFAVDPLTLPELLLSVVLGSTAFFAIELEKWWLRRRTALS